jgi:hypothetical protein
METKDYLEIVYTIGTLGKTAIRMVWGLLSPEKDAATKRGSF